MSRPAVVFLLAAVPALTAAEPSRLTLAPAAVPKPSLKYQLLPDPRTPEPGNAATLYYRAFALFFENKSLLEDIHDEQWDKWLAGPLGDLRDRAVAERLARYRHVFEELELAARCPRCDWQIERRREGIGLLIPDVQGFRTFGRQIALRARLDVATGRPEAALRNLQTGFALARNLGEGPTIFHVLVGAAVANMMCDRVEELEQLPDAPNLYWALTTLPHPFFNPQHAVRAQVETMDNMFPAIKRLEEGPLPEERLQALVAQIQRLLDDFNVRRPEAAEFKTAAAVGNSYEDSKRYLIDRGFPAESVKAMPPLQAVTVAAFREYREAYDEAAKWMFVRDGLQSKGYKEARDRYQEAAEQLDRLFFHGLLRGLEAYDPGLEVLSRATGRLDRRVAALRCLEALRHYAAAHGGKLPASLADLADTPATDDPVTGKPFAYKLNGDKASLSAPPLTGDKPGVGRPVDYEITVRR